MKCDRANLVRMLLNMLLLYIFKINDVYLFVTVIICFNVFQVKVSFAHITKVLVGRYAL